MRMRLSCTTILSTSTAEFAPFDILREPKCPLESHADPGDERHFALSASGDRSESDEHRVPC
jgi:hypothetical protein